MRPNAPDPAQPDNVLGSFAGTFEANLLAFARLLRRDGLLVGPQELELAGRALLELGLSEREGLRLVLRTLFAKSPGELRRFDARFDAFWFGAAPREPLELPRLTRPVSGSLPSLQHWGRSGGDEDPFSLMRYSPGDVRATAGGALAPDDPEAFRRLVRELGRRFATLPSRRHLPSVRPSARADLRRSLRRSLARGGELLELRYRQRRLGKTRLVFVFDVSGSMLLYSAFLLRLAHAFVQSRELGRAEVFGFGTELYHLTPSLRARGAEAALAAAQRAMPGRSGGTRIGMALEQLLERHGALLDRRTVLIIHSDGWDTGELGRLQRAMRTLHERSHHLLWLNPLAASPGYAPLASGMQIAWPYIDTFAAAHDLESLRALARRLPQQRTGASVGSRGWP